MPFVVVSVLLFVLPFDKRFGSAFVKDNCDAHATLLHDRIFHNDKPVDIAFFGTSHTKDAVSDYWLEDALRDKGIDMHVMNFGYCRLGRNMPYLLLKECLRTKKPKYIVLEVTEKENRDGHMDFGYMADSKELFTPVLIFNDNLIQDLFKGLVVRFEAIKQKWLGQYNEPPKRTDDYGHSADWTVAGEEEMQYQKENKMKNYKRSKGFSRWFYNQYSFNYIDKTIALANEHGIKVLFLYLPEYACLDVPEEIDFYKKRGPVLLPPDSLYQIPEHWKDVKHMNDKGAGALASWIADELEGVIKQ